MAVLAALLRLDALRPVPNPGGPTAIATEVQRLRDLAARGIRVPVVLAALPNGFAMRHLGNVGEETHSLGNEIDHAVQAGDTAAVLALWQQGLDTLTQVHHRGTCLSQAFARNLVRCPDGEVACIDFEDDPAAVLPLAVCHVRDALCYAHSTAIYLHASGTLTEGASAGRRGWRRGARRCGRCWPPVSGGWGGCGICPPIANWGGICSGCGRRMTSWLKARSTSRSG